MDEQPAPAGGDAAAADGGAAAAAAPAGGEAAPGAEATNADGTPKGPAETAEPLPFDDELAGLQPLDGTAAADPVAELVDLNSPEAIGKALNPTGTATEGEQLKHAQQLIGRFSGQVGQAKQVLQSIAPYLQKDQAGNFVGFDLAAIGDRMEQANPGSVAALLAARGQKIVPADFGMAEATLEREYPIDLVNALVPQKDMSFQEKVELIKGDPEKLVDLRVQKQTRAAQAQMQQQQAVQAQGQEMQQHLQGLATTDKSFKALIPGITKWNGLLPDALTGKLRADVAYRLAKLDRLLSTDVRKAQGAAIYARAESELMKKFGLSTPAMGGGGLQPTGSRAAGNGVMDALPEAAALG